MNEAADNPIETATGEELDIGFDTALCMHSRVCVLQAPEVFKANTPGQWILPNQMNGPAFAAVARNCPSGAIYYRAKDAVLDEVDPPVNTIRFRPLSAVIVPIYLLWAATGSLAHAAPQSLDELLFAKTQAFSDAGLRGDKATLDALLAPDVAFTNEDGSMPSKAEILASAAAPPQGVEKTIKVTDFKVHAHGPEAVVTFVDVLDETVRGQALRFRYRSTEVWRNEPGGWRIIASQTLTLADDPPAVRLPASVLDAYVGDYDAGAGVKVRISRTDDGLATSSNGGPAVALKPELKDVFFIPGQPQLRRIFKRDADGWITGYVNRTSGQDLRARRL